MIHLILGIFWILMAIPTVLFWKDSILWVLIMSLYANIESSFSAWEASRNPKKKRQRSKWRYSAVGTIHRTSSSRTYSFGRVVRRQPAKL